MSVNRPCECCLGHSHTKVAHKRHYDLYRCVDCGLIFVWPQPKPKELAALYDTAQGYYANTTDLSKTSPQRAVLLNSQLGAIGLKSGSLLDVGCATGSLIYHLRELGWSVQGIEINPGAVSIANAHGLEVASGKIQDHAYTASSFDVIHLGDVIEHVESPALVLEVLRGLLKPDGALCMRTPNAACSFAKLTLPLSRYLKLPWPHSEAPYHLFDFNPASMRQILSKHGFEVLAIEYERTARFAYMIGGMGPFDNLKKQLKINTKALWHWSTFKLVPIMGIYAILLFPIYLLARVFDGLLGRGNIMFVAAKPKSVP